MVMAAHLRVVNEDTEARDPEDATHSDESDASYPVAGVWNRERMATFLEDAVIPIRLGCRTPSGSPWMLSLWFRYRDDALWCATAESADVVTYLRANPEVSFEISVNDPPYRGVRGRGTVTIEPDPEKELLRDLIARYLGGTDSQLARRLLAADRDEVTLRIDPGKIYTWDYSDRMSESDE
jgi:hypothetical protein